MYVCVRVRVCTLREAALALGFLSDKQYSLMLSSLLSALWSPLSPHNSTVCSALSCLLSPPNSAVSCSTLLSLLSALCSSPNSTVSCSAISSLLSTLGSLLPGLYSRVSAPWSPVASLCSLVSSLCSLRSTHQWYRPLHFDSILSSKQCSNRLSFHDCFPAAATRMILVHTTLLTLSILTQYFFARLRFFTMIPSMQVRQMGAASGHVCTSQASGSTTSSHMQCTLN
jgi:hypothetical protein